MDETLKLAISKLQEQGIDVEIRTPQDMTWTVHLDRGYILTTQQIVDLHVSDSLDPNGIRWLNFEPHGFGALPIWGGSNDPQLSFKFADDTIVRMNLYPNIERTRFSDVELPAELTERGIEDVWVELDHESDTSKIFVKMSGVQQPLSCTEDYT